MRLIRVIHKMNFDDMGIQRMNLVILALYLPEALRWLTPQQLVKYALVTSAWKCLRSCVQ